MTVLHTLRGRLRADLRLLLRTGEVSADTLQRLLDGIARGQSLSATARRLGCSYRHAWGVIETAGNTLGVRLLETTIGGSQGGGSRLTAQAEMVRRELHLVRSAVNDALELTVGSSARDAAAADASGTHGAAVAQSRRSRQHGIEHPLLFVAATLESVETGLIDAVGQAFFAETGIRLGHVAAGSGVALELARSGRVDLALTHAPELEQDCINEGWLEPGIGVMRSRFVIVGPQDDPAEVSQAAVAQDPLGAFRRIARAARPFVSRGDRSGTHVREQALWRAVGVEPRAPWYRISSGSGNRALLQEAAGTHAYTLVDQATVRRWGLAESQRVLYQDAEGCRDATLEDRFSLLRVGRGIGNRDGYEFAGEFMGWFTARRYELIRTAAVDGRGAALFDP